MIFIKRFFTYCFILPSLLQASAHYKLVKKVFGNMPLLNNKCIKKIWDKIPPRDVRADRNVQKLLANRIHEFDSSYIILDSGHAHSIAAAKTLYEHGYKPKYYFEPYVDEESGKKDIGVNIQAIAAMKFYAEEYSRYFHGEKLALIVDTHRTYQLKKRIFLSVQSILMKHQGKVTWVTEGFRHYKNKIFSSEDQAKNITAEYINYFEYQSRYVVRNFLNHPQIKFSQFLADPYIDHDENYGYAQYSVTLEVEELPKECKGWRL